MPVAKQISDFLTNPKTYVDYERPPQVIEIGADIDGLIRQEMVKTFALASVIYEDDLAERQKLPFKHKFNEDLALLEAEESEL